MKLELYKKGFVKHNSVEFIDHSNISEALSRSELERFKKHPIFKPLNNFTDEETFVKNFANPIYSVHRQHCFIIVEETDNKVSMKFFYGMKNRREGKVWFKQSKNVEYITVNKETGNVYVGYLHNYHLKKKVGRSIRTNYFFGEPLNNLTAKIKNVLNNYVGDSSTIATEAAEIFISRITRDNPTLSRDKRLLKFYLDKKGIKYPNNFWVYIPHMFGKEYRKLLKSNGNRLIDTFMQLKNLKGKKVKKYLHNVEQLNVDTYLFARNLFGDDWLNQDGDIICQILNTSFNIHSDYSNFKLLVSNEEMKRVYSVFKQVCNFNVDVFTFADHIRMYVQLKAYGETTLKWMSDGQDYNFFNQEHYDWSSKLEFYKKGFYRRIYPDYFKKILEKPIGEYYPKILTNSDEYNSESNSQSNCVKGYIGRCSSFIISLRRGEIESEDRATLEYKITRSGNSEHVYSDRVQSLGRFNSQLEKEWNDVLLKLDKLVLSCHNRKDFVPVKIEKECANGTKLNSDSHFDENGYLVWSNRKKEIDYYGEW